MIATIAVAAGTDDAINNILGLPFIIAMKMIVDFVDMIAMFNAIDHPPFPIELQITSNAVPTSNGEVNVSAHANNSVLAQLEHYEQWRSGQIASSNVSTEKGDQFGNVSPPSSILIKRVHFGTKSVPTNLSASASTIPTSSINQINQSINQRFLIQWFRVFPRLRH